MERDFARLGLREDATKEQVEAAYQRRLAQYKSADYADDPEYARRKIAELKNAYEGALQRAGSGGTFSRVSKAPADGKTARDREDDVEKQEKKNRYMQRKRSIEEEEGHPLDRFRLHQEDAGRTEEETAKPDFSALKEKAESWRRQAKEAAGSIKEGRESDREEDTVYEAVPVSETKTAAPVPNLNPQSADVYEDKKNEKITGIVISLLVFFVGVFFTMCEAQNDDSSYQDYGYSEYYTEADWEICDLAAEVSDEFYNGAMETTEVISADAPAPDAEKLQKAANLFAKRYTEYETVNALSDALYNYAGAYPYDGASDIEDQVRELLYYYNFPDLNFVRGYINPYTGEVIDSMTDYVRYLNRYYKENVTEAEAV